jgi:hypothetical protein
LISNVWSYTFKNSSSNQIYLSSNTTVAQKILIDGDMVTPPNNVISFNVSKNSNNFIEVKGCLRIEGKLNVDLIEQPQSGTLLIVLIRYNCPNETKRIYFDKKSSNSSMIDQSQIVISTNYEKSNCDRITSKLVQSQQTISVSLSSTINGNCKSNLIFNS